MASPVSTWLQKGVARTLWEGVTASSVTNGAETAAGLPDKTVYVTGNFGDASVVTIEGSNNTATGPFVDCVDPQGNAIAFSADGQEVILENPQWIRPRVSGATGGTDVDVIMISRGAVR
jgi:hypothetical protein